MHAAKPPRTGAQSRPVPIQNAPTLTPGAIAPAHAVRTMPGLPATHGESPARADSIRADPYPRTLPRRDNGEPAHGYPRTAKKNPGKTPGSVKLSRYYMSERPGARFPRPIESGHVTAPGAAPARRLRRLCPAGVSILARQSGAKNRALGVPGHPVVAFSCVRIRIQNCHAGEKHFVTHVLQLALAKN